MNNRDHQDALIDQLLREILGGDRPRDLTERVLARAKSFDRKRQVWWISTAASIAACIIFAATLYLLWPRSYPMPHIDQGDAMVSTPTLERGSRVATEENAAQLNLGGYAEVALAPESALTISGNRFQEKILLERGRVDVRVTKKKGTFDVAVGPALVSVTGTQFSVDVLEDEFTDTGAQKFKVHVKEGSVQVRDGIGAKPITLTAMDAEGDFPVSPKTEEVSPKSVEIAPKINDKPTFHTEPRDLNPDLMDGSRAGQMFGNRSGMIVGRGLSYAPNLAQRYPEEFDPGISRPLQVVTADHAEIVGILRRDPSGKFFVLNTNQNPLFSERRGVFLLFAEQSPTVPFYTLRPMLQTFVRVRWEGGKVQSIEPAFTAHPGASNNTAATQPATPGRRNNR